MKAGERLVNGIDNYDVAHYHWYNNEILKSDSYYDLVGEGTTIAENELPQLYRVGEGSNRPNADFARAKIEPLFNSNDYPKLYKRFDLDKLINQLVTIYGKTGNRIYNVNFEVILTQLEKSIR